MAVMVGPCTRPNQPRVYHLRVASLREKPWFRTLSLVIGVALTAAAVVFALSDNDTSELWRAEPWRIVALLGAAALHLFITGVLFWAVTLSFDATPRVTVGRMSALIAASSLLNYLPLYAGVIGRAAYLKALHKLPLRQSFLIQLAVLVLSVLVPGVAVLIIWLLPKSLWPWAGLIAIAIATAVTGPIAGALLARRIVAPWSWAPLRVVETLLAATRLWLAFGIASTDTTYGHCVLLAAVSMFITVALPLPNGLGAREWVLAAIEGGPIGVKASLIDRVAEAIVFSVAGAWSIHVLRRDLQSAPADLPGTSDTP